MSLTPEQAAAAARAQAEQLRQQMAAVADVGRAVAEAQRAQEGQR